MHYIRLLRPARFNSFDACRPLLSLLITITTDLGDSFLCPGEPVELVVTADDLRGESILLPIDRPARWSAGMRVLDIKAPVKPNLIREPITCIVKIHPATQSQPLGFLTSSDVLPWTVAEGSPANQGLIMPASVNMVGEICSPVSVRRLRLDTGSQPGDALDLTLDEDIGESIARHVWDAGVVTSCFLADSCRAHNVIRDILPIRSDSVAVLELGTGVGVLGISTAGILRQAAAVQGRELKAASVLLTDLPEAEERARSNIREAEKALVGERASGYAPGVLMLQYENLDWDEGRHGRFGPLVSSRPWDFVVLSDCTYNVDSLPALVGTLSALHAAKPQHGGTETSATSSVILATKPRHSSEQALFGLLAADGWRYLILKSIPLPKLGEEAEVVEIYLLEKGKGTT
ncbi:putative methyltransferase-domain-containing protein [Xylariaceae sp. FL0662B]|nr:putative methyltransferase-domain-containing protein [Xylariaceae sp. FL0662B]